MGDINKLQLSRERLTQALWYLLHKEITDDETVSYIRLVENSIKTLDAKITEFVIGDQER